MFGASPSLDLIALVKACCWYGIGTVQLDGKSWILQAEIGSEFTEAYAASIHWAPASDFYWICSQIDREAAQNDLL